MLLHRTYLVASGLQNKHVIAKNNNRGEAGVISETALLLIGWQTREGMNSPEPAILKKMFIKRKAVL